MYLNTHIFLTWLMRKADDHQLQRSLGCHVLPLVCESAALMLISTDVCQNKSFVLFYFVVLHFSCSKDLLKHPFICV